MRSRCALLPCPADAAAAVHCGQLAGRARGHQQLLRGHCRGREEGPGSVQPLQRQVGAQGAEAGGGASWEGRGGGKVGSAHVCPLGTRAPPGRGVRPCAAPTPPGTSRWLVGWQDTCNPGVLYPRGWCLVGRVGTAAAWAVWAVPL